MSDTALETVVLYEFTIWDNDIDPCPEFYDIKNKVYYMNDHCTPGVGVPNSLYGTPVEIIKTHTKIHNDDVRAMIRKKLGDSFSTTRF